MRKLTMNAGWMTALTLVLALTSSAWAGKKYKVSASLSAADTTMTAKAKYDEKSKKGDLVQCLKVEVFSGEPLHAIPVFVNGQFIGAVNTDALGHGIFQLKTPNYVYPRITPGDFIAVGTLTGVFFTKNGKYDVQGDLSSDSGVDGWVKYREHIKPPGLDRRLDVKIKHATPGETFDVSINGVYVATLTANDDGEARLKLRCAAWIGNEGDGWDPIPDTVPSLHTGDVVQVGAMSATLN